MPGEVDKEDKKGVNLDEQKSKQEVKSVLTDIDVKELAKDLLREDKSVKEVMSDTGLSFEVVRALKGAVAKEKGKEAKKVKEELKETVAKEEKDQEKKRSIPYSEVEPGDVFLRNFLSEFDFKEQFIDLLCRRVKRRNALPYPNDLAADIQDMPSGITNPKSANYIAEEYGYVLKDYEKRLKSTNKLRGSMGFAVDLSGSHDTGHDGSHGILLDRYKGDNGPARGFYHDEGKEKEKPPVDPIKEARKRYRARKAEHLEELMDVKEIADMERELDGGKGKQEEEIKRLQEENRRLQEGDGHRNDPNSEMRERIVKLEDDLRQRDADRMQRLEDDLKAARNTPPPQQNPGSLTREEVIQMISQNIDVQNKNLTRDDLEKYVDRRMNDRSALTKNDLTYLEARDKLHLEEKKLDESGKTRDVIGSAIGDGFKRFGNIVGRMMTGEGETGGGTPVSGYSDQAGDMMQVNCPGCHAVITAPINSPMVICPGCGKRWTVEPPGQEQIPPKVEEKNPPPGQEQIPPKVEEKNPPLAEFASKEKEALQKSLEDAKEGKIEPLGTSDTPAIIPEQTTDAPKVMPEQTTDAPKTTPEPVTDAVDTSAAYVPTSATDTEPIGVEKIAENIAIGEAADYLEEEVKKKKELEEKPVRKKRCPVCKKPFKNRRAVASHITQKHPEYKK